MSKRSRGPLPTGLVPSREEISEWQATAQEIEDKIKEPVAQNDDGAQQGSVLDEETTAEAVPELSTRDTLFAVKLRLENAKLKQRKQNLRLRKKLANWSLIFVGIQLLIANLFMGWYLWHNRTDPDSTIMVAWVTGTVVEAIGILWVIARSLFPFKDKNRNSNGEKSGSAR